MPIILQWLKAIPQIKRAGSIIDCDHFDSMDSNFVGRTQGSGQSIHQQVLPQTLPGSGPIDSQPAKVRHRNGAQAVALSSYQIFPNLFIATDNRGAWAGSRARGSEKQNHFIESRP